MFLKLQKSNTSLSNFALRYGQVWTFIIMIVDVSEIYNLQCLNSH